MALDLLPANYGFLRLAAAFVTSFVVLVIAGPAGIQILKRIARERIVSDSARLNELHASKKDTPTMGGVLLLLAVLVSSLLWCDWSNRRFLTVTACTAGLACIGGMDDWIKARHRRQGLSARTKFVAQWLVCLFSAFALWLESTPAPHETALSLPAQGLLQIFWPTIKTAWPLGLGFIPWVALVVVATSNAVNLTDGLDGLATGVCLPIAIVLTGLLWIVSQPTAPELLAQSAIPQAIDVAVLLSAVCGSLTGFLWFNGYPAQVFMGDVGSLAIGGWLGMGAVICRQELLLLVVGGVLVAETLSVILQVASFKLTGRRLIRCSPLHNHFVFGGMPENRIVVRFWMASLGICVLGLAMSIVV